MIKLVRKQEMNRCTQYAVMRDYFKKEYLRLKIKLRWVEKLSANNDLEMGNTFAEAQQTAGILGLYMMV